MTVLTERDCSKDLSTPGSPLSSGQDIERAQEKTPTGHKTHRTKEVPIYAILRSLGDVILEFNDRSLRLVYL